MCRAEAPEVEQFARDNADRVQVIGLGAQDSFEEAEDFVQSFGAKSFPMLWDPSFDSWAQLGVAGQPAWLLVGPDGRLVDGTYGAVPEDRVLELSDALLALPGAQ